MRPWNASHAVYCRVSASPSTPLAPDCSVHRAPRAPQAVRALPDTHVIFPMASCRSHGSWSDETSAVSFSWPNIYIPIVRTRPQFTLLQAPCGDWFSNGNELQAMDGTRLFVIPCNGLGRSHHYDSHDVGAPLFDVAGNAERVCASRLWWRESFACFVVRSPGA